MINFRYSPTLSRLLQRPDMQVLPGSITNDVVSGPRAANAASQFALQLGNSNLGANFSGRVTLMFLGLIIITFLVFGYSSRSFQA